MLFNSTSHVRTLVSYVRTEVRVQSLMSQHRWFDVVVTLYSFYYSYFYTLNQYYYQLLQFNNRTSFNKHLQYLFLAYIAGPLIAILFYQLCENSVIHVRTAMQVLSLMSWRSWSDVVITLYLSYYSYFCTLKEYYYQLLQFNNRPCSNKYLQYLFLAYIAGLLVAI